MGDNDDRVAGHEPADHHEQALRAGRVQAGGRLVQDQHRGVPQEGPGQADPLALAAGQRAAALADGRVVAARQGGDEKLVLRVRGRAAAAYLLGRGAGPAVPDVVRHRAREEQRLLGQQRDVVAQGVQGELAEVDPVDQDPAVVRVTEAQQQAGDGGLPAPLGPVMASTGRARRWPSRLLAGRLHPDAGCPCCAWPAGRGRALRRGLLPRGRDGSLRDVRYYWSADFRHFSGADGMKLSRVFSKVS